MDDVARFEARCAHLRAGLIVADEEGRITRVGDEASQLLGVPAPKLLGRRLANMLQRWSGRPRADVRRALEGSSWTLTWSVPGTDGERMLRAVTRSSDEGIELIIDDISERMRRAHELNALYLLTDRLEAAVLREERSAPIAHDLGNVLTVLGTAIEQSGGSAERALLRRAMELTRRLREDAEARTLGVGPVNVDEVLQQMLPLQRALAGSDVALDLDVTQDATVLWSAEHLRSVVSNLVVNARRAGASRITIRVGVESGEIRSRGRVVLPRGRWLRLRVQDDGVGMTDEEQELALRLAPHGSESGVGLPWVRHLASEARGALCLESTEGVGTTVHVIVPVADVSDAMIGGSEPGSGHSSA